jgi:hypothetical protein
MKTALLLFLSIGLATYGVHGTYLSVSYNVGTLRCSDFLQDSSRANHVVLADCLVDLHNTVTIEHNGTNRRETFAPVVSSLTATDPIALFLQLDRDRSTRAGEGGPLRGAIVRRDDRTRLAIARTSSRSPAYDWRVLEPAEPPNGTVVTLALLLGLAIGTAAIRQRLPAPLQSQVGNLEATTQPASSERSADRTVAILNVERLARARLRLRIVSYLLAPILMAPTFGAATLLDDFGDSVWPLQLVALLGIAVFNVILATQGWRRGVAAIRGPIAARIGRVALWSAIASSGVAAYALAGLHNDVLGIVMLYLAVWLIPIIVGIRAVAILNGFNEPHLGLQEAKLLQGRHGRPGLFASRRYVSVSLWIGLSTLAWLAGAIVGGAIALLNAGLRQVLPLSVNLVNLLFPRIVKPLIGSASRASQRRRRYGSPAARAVMMADARPPILILRSFVDDDLEGREDHAWFRSADTFEEVIADRLWSAGPVVAIGQPGEGIPRAGAAREYVSHELWQTRVRELVRDAAMIFVVLGHTPGIAWEVENIARLGMLDKTVLVVPPVSDAELQARIGMLQSSGFDAAAQLIDELPQGTLMLLPGRQRRVALTARRRHARFYVEAVEIAEQAFAGTNLSRARIQIA